MDPDVDYRRDDATEHGEGWPRGRADHFNLSVGQGPWRLEYDERDVTDVSFWAASGGVADVSVAVAADDDDGEGAALVAYMESAAARAFAAQLLTAADAADADGQFTPAKSHADRRYVDRGFAPDARNVKDILAVEVCPGCDWEPAAAIMTDDGTECYNCGEPL